MNYLDLDLKTLDDFLCWAEELFVDSELVYGHGTDNPWDEAVAIARHVLQLAPDQTQEILTRPLAASEAKDLVAIAWQRIKTRKPLPYIIHEAWFANEKYYIDERAIIPRSPFAELIHTKFKPWIPAKPMQILDLATGSACIAIACSKVFPLAKIDAVDISLSALEVAGINIKLHNCEQQVTTICSDLFAELAGKQYDLIVTNPPYVPQNEAESLSPEYHYEPKLALYSGMDGLTCTKQILAMAQQFLTEDGVLFVEVGATWEELQAQYPQVPFTWVEFAYGGEGVFMFTKQDLLKYQTYFK